MKVIILAAGRGTRISKRIGDIPKCTVDVGGEPLIRRTVRMLKENGVEEIGIILGYRHADVSRALAGLDVREFFNPFYHVTNSIASLWFAREMLTDEDTVLCNGDVFWTDEILAEILADRRDFVMLGDQKRADDGDYFFRTENGVLRAHGKELTRAERDCEYVGISRIAAARLPLFRTRLAAMIERGECDKWWENVLYDLSATEPIFVRDVGEAFWAEVDFIEDYQRILDYLCARGAAAPVVAGGR